ncbi:MAG: HAD family hydrolase [Spirochaetia bacterium]
MIKALIFDFDGLIIDTEGVIFEVWEDFYQSYGQSIPRDSWLKCIGSTNAHFDPYTHLEETGGIKLIRKEVEERIRKTIEKRLRTEPLRPGVQDYLKEARSLGLPMAIASSSSLEWVTTLLNSHGIDHFFSVIKTKDHVSQVKPSPELFLKAARGLSEKPENTLVFEDSYHGVVAAHKAGSKCTAVPNFMTKTQDFSLADRVINSMEEIPLTKLISGIEG